MTMRSCKLARIVFGLIGDETDSLSVVIPGDKGEEHDQFVASGGNAFYTVVYRFVVTGDTRDCLARPLSAYPPEHGRVGLYEIVERCQ